MPIQFHCSGCGQPIEVDDDAAHQPVTCPYCRKTGAAPAETASNFDPRVRPVDPGRSAGPLPSRTYPAGTTTGHEAILAGNKLAWWSLGLMSASFLAFIGFMVLLASIGKDAATLQDPVKVREAFDAWAVDHGGLMMLMTTGICVLPLMAAVMAAVSLARGGRPKWPAYTTLGIISGGVLLMCLGTLLQISLGSGV